MKKVLLFLAVLAMVAFTACNNNEQSTETKDIEKQYHKIVLEYAEQNEFEMSGYEEVVFKLIPIYDVSALSVKYDSIFNSKESFFYDLLDNEKSALYQWVRVSDYTLIDVSSTYTFAFKHNKKLIDADIEYLQFFINMIDNYYVELEQCNEVLVYNYMWIYNTNKNGFKEKHCYYGTLPLLNNFNFENMICEDMMSDDDIALGLSKLKTDEEIVNRVDSLCVEDITRYYNPTNYESLDKLYEIPSFYKEKVDTFKSYLERYNE